jgi:hypothetical protein
MADEVEDGPDGPDIDALAAEAEEQHAITPSLEDLARNRGWKPKEEWSGEGEWRDAASFIEFGLDKGRDTSKELKELRETTSRIADTQARIAQEAADRARAEERGKWEQVHAKAVDEGDHDAARQAVSQIAALNVPVRDTVGEFATKNPWFNTDPAARAVAQAAAERNKHLPPEEQFKAAQEEVHKRFPEYAPQEAKAIEVANPAATARTVNKTKTFHDLPAEAQEAARALIRRNLTTPEGYVKNYFNKEGSVE